MRVMVTGAGSPTGVAVIRSLVERQHDVLAADPNPHAAGFALATACSVCPWADDQTWATWAAETAEWFAPDAVVLTIVTELAAARGLGLPMWAASAPATAVTLDKAAFAVMLDLHGVPTIPTSAQAPPVGAPGRWVVKPVAGEGSRATFVDVGTDHARHLMRQGMICQPFIDGREWEADVFAHQGHLVGGVAYWKERMNGGITWAATTFPLDDIAELLCAGLAACRLDGPLNVGGFLTADGHVLCEINGRFSHNFRIGEAAGTDPIGYYLDHVTGRTPDPARLQAKAGVRMERYLVETVWSAAA